MQKIMFNDKCFLTDLTLKGIKTQTRRIIKVENIIARHWNPIFKPKDSYYKDYRGYCQLINSITDKVIRPRYKVGEIVAVAQSYDKADVDPTIILGDGSNGFIFDEEGWKNKMYVRPDLMPHRIKVTGVRAERLQDISDEDCLAEGIQFAVKHNHFIAVLTLRQAQKFGLVEIHANPLPPLSTSPAAKVHGSQTHSYLYISTNL